MPKDPLRHDYGQINRSYGMQMATTPAEDDGPIWMVNLMRYHDVAQYGDGEPSDAAPVSGREADDRYAPVDVLRAIGAEVVLFGDVDTQLLGDSPRWDRVGVVRYPTRRAFIEMQQRPDFQAKHVHKAAGMAETIVMGCRPVGALPDGVDESAYPDWRTVPHPPTPEDGPVVVVHVIKYSEERAAEMGTYQDAAFKVAGPHGARIGGWFDVEGTIIGDGRAWDQVRFNVFPSKAAFMAVAMDPARLQAQRAHREPAIADTYALVVRAGINRLPDPTR